MLNKTLTTRVMKCSRAYLAVLRGAVLGTALLMTCWGLCLAQDVDHNGIPDATEQALVERFKPAFMLQSLAVVTPEGNRPVEVEPEPVEILAANGTSLTVHDLWLTKTTEYFNPPPLPTVEVLPYDSSPLASSGMTLADVHAVSYDFADRRETYAPYQFDYGGPGNEDPDAWANTYVNSPQYARRHSPTVYARLFNESGQWLMQYWMFYPFDDWVNKHEGDWEHINVLLAWSPPAGPSTASIVGVKYFFHDKFIPVDTPDHMQDLQILDGTHPVVYVGGFGDARACPVINTYGIHGGGSYPAPGRWTLVQFINWPVPGCERFPDNVSTYPFEWGPLSLGRFVSYEDVHARWMPDITQVDASYWTANPDMQWIKPNVYWGHEESNSPLGRENTAPLGPFYHLPAPDGECHNYLDDMFYSLSPLPNQMKQLYIILTAEPPTGRVVLHPEITVTNEGGLWKTRPAPTYAFDQSTAQLSTITVPRFASENGVPYSFLQWDDGSTDLTDQVTVPVVNPFHPGADTKVVRAWYAPATTDVTPSVMALGGGVRAHAAAWGDFDNDGKLDLLIADTSNHIHLFTNNSRPASTSFTEAASTGLSAAHPVTSITCADYDNDGRLDVYLSTKVSNTLYRNLGNAEGCIRSAPRSGSRA